MEGSFVNVIKLLPSSSLLFLKFFNKTHKNENTHSPPKHLSIELFNHTLRFFRFNFVTHLHVLYF